MPVPEHSYVVNFQLPHIPSWSHRFATEILAPGDLAVDLTAGQGRDTLALERTVGEDGCVIAFDIQKQALDATAELLAGHGARVMRCAESGSVPEKARGVWLVHDDHAKLCRYLPRSPQVVIANLGYLPGGDREIVTRPDSTRAAFEGALTSLRPGGRLVCVMYIVHAGGREESLEVERLLNGLSSRDWFVLRLQVSNRVQAPFLMVVEKRR